MCNIYEKLLNISQELKAPKSEYNKFGDFKYRSFEGICEALKPLLVKHRVHLIFEEEPYMVGDRYYIKSTVTIVDLDVPDKTITRSTSAREPLKESGRNETQLSGSTISYVRKYLVNGIFLIDDTKDSDAGNPRGEQETPPSKSKGKGGKKDNTEPPPVPPELVAAPPEEVKRFTAAVKNLGIAESDLAFMIKRKYGCDLKGLTVAQMTETYGKIQANPEQIIKWIIKEKEAS